MSSEDDFEPRLGRMRARGSRQGRKFLHRILAAANLARGGSGSMGRQARFSGSRIGRGAGVGRVLASRDRFAAFRARRVIIKSRIVKLAGKGVGASRAHLRYVERDGTTRDGGRGQLYGADTDKVDGKTFLDRQAGDRHQFRFIVSPEDGADYDDLKPLTRRLMARMEEDLGTKLEWVAVDHFNTGHPHSHIILRGKNDRGHDLVIARDYLTSGMRERAAELIDLDLGPRCDDAIRERLHHEVQQERLTSIDRAFLREAGRKVLVRSLASGAFDQTMRMGRLRKLERMGLAEQVGASHWRIAPDLEATLRRMGERGDIIRTMQRAFAARGATPALADQVIYDPATQAVRPLVGRMLDRGLSDELNDRYYLIIEATDGRSHYVDIGKPDLSWVEGSENVAPHGNGAIVRIDPVAVGVREADRTVAAVAAANDGHYDIDVHLRHDPSATEAFAQAHVRRLEAIRRLTGGVTREADGTWAIAPDHLDRAAAYEAMRAKDRPVTVEALSSQPLEKLVGAEAATWLDRELTAVDPTPLRDAGFGREARDAQARRKQWLMEQGLAQERGGTIRFQSGMIAELQRRELRQVAGELSVEFVRAYREVVHAGQIEGIYRRRVDLVSGRFAVIERARDFTLVPWRPVLERQSGKAVSGLMRDGQISWSFGRRRDGPWIS